MAGNIVYTDFAPGAAQDSTYTASGATSYSDLDLAAGGSDPYITLELQRWVLNGDYVALDTSDDHVRLWSTSLSSVANGTFTTAPTLTIVFGSVYSSAGVTIVGDRVSGEYPAAVTVTWYRNNTQLDQKSFTPNSVVYFCSNNVENFNKIVISFSKTSLQQRRLRVEQIMIGTVRYFEGNEIVSANAINQMDLSSSALPASQMDWTLYSESGVDFMFQIKQPLELRDGNTTIGVYYITDSRRLSTNIYQVTAQDAIGVLGEQMFSGGAYLGGVSAKTLFSAIVDGTFDIEYQPGLADKTLYGLLLRQTKREALQQVLFAWGACCRTDGDGIIRVFTPPTMPETITAGETYVEGLAVETAPVVTKVSVTAHTYTLDANGKIEVLGNKYSDSPWIYNVANPDINPYAIANEVRVTDATLVSEDNYYEVMMRLLDYTKRRKVHVSKILWDGQKLGDCLTQPTPYGTTQTGNAESVSITLSGIIAAEVQSREVLSP